jgi:hypothetical protein
VTARRVVGVVDTDSFAKWGSHLLSATPGDWSLELVTLATPRSASAEQLRAAFRGVDARLADVAERPAVPLGIDAVVERIRRDPPDAVLVSVIGPVAELLVDLLHRRVPERPVVVSGLPGISFPAKWKGVFYRARADLFVLHSRREVRAYEELAEHGGVVPHFALATLPFARVASEQAGATAPVPDSVVFAAQPSVPAAEEDRAWLAHRLADTARRHPEWRVVVKTRARAGEQQTHVERFPYADLVPADAPANLVVEAGPMSEHLDRAVALVTVSSTAVLEAAARGIPALTLTDFGVGRKTINEVFVGSGLEGDADDLVHGRFRRVLPEWMADNYFHPRSDDDWVARAEALMVLRDEGALPDRPAARRSRGGALRRAWERRNALGAEDTSALGTLAALIGTPIRAVKRRLRRLARALRRARGAATAAPDVTAPTPAAGGTARAVPPGNVAGASVERPRDRDEELVPGRDAR